MVKTQLGLHTVLGVSNISFGLPNRGLVNCNFLAMALHSGLDLPIINPNIDSMTGAVRAYRLLANYDVNSVEYIEAYGNDNAQAPKTERYLLKIVLSTMLSKKVLKAMLKKLQKNF